MRLKKLTAALLALALCVGLGGCKKSSGEGGSIVSASRYIGQARGFFVTAGSGREFPATADLAAQQVQLDEMVRFAAENKLNTIFFEARAGATATYSSKQFPADRALAAVDERGKALDALGYLASAAKQNKVQVFAVVHPFSMSGSLPDDARNPFEGLAVSGESLDPADEKLHKLVAAECAALLKNYEIAGVVLDGMDASFAQTPEAAAGVEALVRAVSAAMRKADATAALGVAFAADSEHNAMDLPAAQRLTGEGVVKMLLPRIGSTVDSSGENGYLAVLERWTATQLGTAELYTINTLQQDAAAELHNQLLANAVSGKVSGAVLQPYSLLAGSSGEERELVVSLLAAGKTLPPPADLSISQALVVSYPRSGVTVYDKSIYIMGTSNPAQPLTLDGKEVERTGTQGTFGVAAELAMGQNSFTFAQGSASTTVKVSRAQAPAVAPITKATTGSLFPTCPLGVDNGETVEVVCVGPSGASITATLDGVTVVMTQSTQASAGMPATFKASFALGGYDADKVSNAGKVTYVVGYNGNHEVQKSEGEIFVAGKNVPLVVEVLPEQYVASVLTDVSSEDNFVQSLKAGARVAVAGKVNTARSGNRAVAYKLPSGGYVMANKTRVVQDPAECTSDITDITKESGNGWEQYTFSGGQPAVLADQHPTQLNLRFLSTKMTADPVAALVGGIVSAVTRTDTKDGVELVLEFAEGSLWGYDIVHEEGSTKLFLRQAPARSQTFGKPLEGITVLLDPGHGGSDPGAPGVAGEGGPAEADLNMAVSSVAKFRLEQLGAQVTLTRTAQSERVSLDARTFQAQQEHPHIFLAVHHNSTVLVRDLAGVRRMEAYYWEGIAKGFADSLMQRLGETMGRNTTKPENAYYYVTRLTFAPAVLFEMGFVVNPAQYEESCTQAAVLKAANGIAQAVLDAVSPQAVVAAQEEATAGTPAPKVDNARAPMV